MSFDISHGDLAGSLAVAFTEHKTASHWKLVPEGTDAAGADKLLLAWHESAGEDFHPFLVPVTATTITQMLEAWLRDADLDHPRFEGDGENVRGHRIHSTDSNFYVFATIEPAWKYLGK